MSDPVRQLPTHELLLLRETLRMLLAENPSLAEEYVLALELHELGAIVNAGDGIIHLVSADGDDLGYIGVRNGTRETTARLPGWAHLEDVVEVHLPEPGATVYKALQSRVESFRNSQSELFDALGLQRAIETVDGYRGALGPEVASRVQAMRVEGDLSLAERCRRSPDCLEIDGINILNAILQEYLRFGLSGDGLIPLLATVMLLYTAGPFGTEAVKAVASTTDGRFGQPVMTSLSNFDAFFSALDQLTGKAWRAALGAARMLRESGDKRRDDADKALTFDEFHFGLFAALGCYRTSSVLFARARSEGLRLGKPEVVDEAIKAQHFLEEMRVRILASISWAADFNTHENNFTLPRTLEWWVVTQYLESPERTPAEVINLYSQLTFPSFIKELALARFELLDHRLRERGLARVVGVILALKEGGDRIRVLDQGVFLQCALGYQQDGLTWQAEPSRVGSYLEAVRALRVPD